MRPGSEVGSAAAFDVCQHDSLGFFQIGKARAADQIDRTRIKRCFCIMLAGRREPQCGLQEVGFRLVLVRPGSPSTSNTRAGGATGMARNRRSRPIVHRRSRLRRVRARALRAACRARTRPSRSPPRRGQSSAPGPFLVPGIDVQPDRTLETGSGEALRTAAVIDGRLAGPGAAGAIYVRHSDILGERPADVLQSDLHVTGEAHRLGLVEPGALEVGEDVQFLDSFPRADKRSRAQVSAAL